MFGTTSGSCYPTLVVSWLVLLVVAVINTSCVMVGTTSGSCYPTLVVSWLVLLVVAVIQH